MNNSFLHGKNNSFISKFERIPNNPFMDTFGKRMRSRIAEMETSEAEIARRLGISARRFSYYVNDEREPDHELLNKIFSVLGVTPDYLFGFSDIGQHLGNTPDLPSMPNAPANYVAVSFLEAKAGMGAGQLSPDAFGAPRYFESDLISALRASADDLFAMEVDGQSMEGILFSGDQILIHRGKVNVSEPGIFVLWDGDGIVCKWVERAHGSDPAMYRVFSENKRFKDYNVLADEAVIHGRVVWFARRL